jgi:hypothetical protein
MTNTMNTWLHTERARNAANTADLAGRLFGPDPDPDALLDQLADEELRDPDVVQKLSPATRRQLVEHVQARDVLSRELTERRRRLPDDAA